MPFMIASHQAPVLPLKRWKPAWFSGLGLVLGTMAPDLAFVFRLDEIGSPASHSFLGQLYLTVPLVLVLHALATGLVFPWLLPHMPDGPPFHSHALARCHPATDARSLFRVALSGLVGGLTHVTLDGFTHGNHAGWALALVPALATPVPHIGGAAPLHDALQLWLSILFAVFAFRAWDRMVHALPPAGPGAAAVWDVHTSPPAVRYRVRLGLGAAALLGALVAPVLKRASSPGDILELAGYGAVTFATLTAVLAAFAHRAREVLDRVMLEVDGAFEG
jgi:hypothetical protein